MATSRTFEIMREMQAAQKAEAEKLKVNVHPETVRRVFDMQREYVPCIVCNTITNTDVHVDYNGGISVFTKYVCPKCKNEFMEKDIPRGSVNESE